MHRRAKIVCGSAGLHVLRFVTLVALARPAHGFVPEGLLAAGAQYSAPLEARAFGLAEMELLDGLGLRLEAAVATRRKEIQGIVWAGPTLSLDVTRWAPALFCGVGWHSEPASLAATLRLELRRYVSLHSAIGGGVGAEWDMPRGWGVSAMLGYFYRL